MVPILWKLIKMLLPMLMALLPIQLWTAIILPIFSGVWEKVIEKVVENLLTRFVDARSVEENLDNVKRRSVRIKAMPEDAEQRRCIVREDVLTRLSELRGVAFDIDDLVEEFDAKKEEGAEHKIKWLWYCKNVSEEINSVQKRCEAITTDKDKFNLSEDEAPRSNILEQVGQLAPSSPHEGK